MSSPQYSQTADSVRPAKFTGLATASLILGMIAAVFSIIPVVNLVGVVVGLVGVVLGAVGLFGSRKIMASIGVAISILAIVLSFLINKSFVDHVDRNLGTGTGTVSTGSAVVTTATLPVAPPSPPQFGNTYTWPSGLAIEVNKPMACKPSPSSHPQTVQRGVKFGIVITNNSTQTFETATLSFGMQAQFAGRTAERIIDLTGDCKVNNFEAATVLPGKTFAYSVALAVDQAPGEMQLTFQPTLFADKVAYIGQV